ncbi:MAG: Peptidase, M50 family [Microgenomates group bacterium GW2011_GWF2_47_9]|nr:MAG: Peptidase, M50 family [Microgenomates group bacterium GW2011_GWF2_47_9]
MLSTLFSSPLIFLLYDIALLAAITVHEFAHALAADKLGDPTPRLQGRLTLNPLAHLDPLGTIALLVMSFGWGKPVVFDPYNLRNPKRDTAIISLAGPVSNLLLAGLLSFALRAFALGPIVSSLLVVLVHLNIALAVFNLVPVYPLDGEKILTGLLSPRLAVEYANIMRQWGTIILLFMILPIGGTSPISALISPIISFITNLLL